MSRENDSRIAEVEKGMKKVTDIVLINSSISRFRTECMGVAAIWVLAVHALDFGIHLPSCLSFFEKLMSYGQVGVNMFFFLSGIGIYFSLSKGGSLADFCLKRCKRVYVPYLLISFPCLLILQIMDDFHPLWFVLELTTLSYWIAQKGTWYVPVILLFYVLILFFNKLYRKTKRHGAVTLFSMILCSLVYVVLRGTSSAILGCLGSALSRLPVFLGGFWLGEQIQEEKKVNILWVVLMVVSVPIRSLFHLEAEHIAVTLTLELLAVAVCFIVAKALELGWVYRIFHSPLFFLGSCSLEIYLLNVYLAAIMENIMKQFQLQNRAGMYLMNIVLSVGIGYLVRKGLQKRNKAGRN